MEDDPSTFASLAEINARVVQVLEDRAEFDEGFVMPSAPGAVPLPIAVMMCPTWARAVDMCWKFTSKLKAHPADFELKDAVAMQAHCNDVYSTVLAQRLELHAYDIKMPELGLAWALIAATMDDGENIRRCMPQLDALVRDHVSDLPDGSREVRQMMRRLDAWWHLADGKGEFVFTSPIDCAAAIIDEEDRMDREREEREAAVKALCDLAQASKPGMVVIKKKGALKFTADQAPYKELVDLRLPLVVARDLHATRRTLMMEYPHAMAAVDLLLRDLREGEPVSMKPMLLLGDPGSGKSRLVRRIADLLGVSTYRFDCAGSHDGQFSGSPKAWHNSQPSVPLRAVAVYRQANPILMLDEIEKSGTGSHNGNLWSSVIPYLERETSSQVRDTALDAECDLSWVSFIATANDDRDLPRPLRDRFRVIRVPSPTLVHLPALARAVLLELAEERNLDPAWVPALEDDELEVAGRAWARTGFSMRRLQKIVAATLDARDQCAARH
ncbi:AAA family ATPase [Tardiphaga sp. vice154]|uniref:AAA family ATPase n=1 Tax=Tardiphaga sp. vice154 TaxID=2592814 RepID=UPI001FEDD7E0|nr:AAA family ATPase [Tardiphaga sp. vice154]